MLYDIFLLNIILKNKENFLYFCVTFFFLRRGLAAWKNAKLMVWTVPVLHHWWSSVPKPKCMVKTSSAKELGVFWVHAWLLARRKICSHACIGFGFILMHGKLVYFMSVCGGRAGSLLNCCTVADCPQPQDLLRNFCSLATWKKPAHLLSWHFYSLYVNL